ncbi:CoA transferase subunit A [Clostridium psychrophilum]|uniref:CoA transferase subunit A n=1 Tax=Clostridium psychrophilum TaxID=132926 RepID=UPI001C0C10CA|nr:CoA transferase subunit A [Clostridium psychrophilum]MBU3179763.1 CoA transferase subunit A [Clostridium psychrophilum]
MNKVMDLDEVMEKVHDGATIMFGGFLGVGAPIKTIDKLVEKGVKDLTIISVVNSYPGQDFDIARLYKNKQVKKLITAHSGTCKLALEQFKNGDIEIEYFPMGSLVEKIRAAGSGLGGVLTPTGIGTLVEKGKQKILVDSKMYLIELPLKADFAFIKGYKGDRLGNIQYRGLAINTNPIMAMGAQYTVAEVNEIVEVGGIEPESVGTPSVFVNAVVKGYTFDEHKKVYTDLWVNSNQLK